MVEDTACIDKNTNTTLVLNSEKRQEIDGGTFEEYINYKFILFGDKDGKNNNSSVVIIVTEVSNNNNY